MMDWYGGAGHSGGPGGWGDGRLVAGQWEQPWYASPWLGVTLWALVIAALVGVVVVLVTRRVGGPARTGPAVATSTAASPSGGATAASTEANSPTPSAGSPVARQLLDERFARGELDQDEYLARRAALEQD